MLVYPLLLAALLLSVLGCGSPATPSNAELTKPYEGITLRVACPGNPAAAAVQQLALGWARSNGARVEVVAYDSQDPSPPAMADADVWIVPPWRLGRRADADSLLPLPDAGARRDNFAWTRLLPLYRDQLLLWGRTVYALPLLGESPICVYRADLFREAKLPPPATWQDFEKAAAHFHHHPPAGFDGFSLPPLPEDADALDREFFAIAASFARRAAREDEKVQTPSLELFSFHYDLESGKPRIAEPGFVEALALLQRLQSYRNPRTSRVPQETFRDGKAVLALADASWIARFQQKDSAVQDKFGICQIPGSNVYYDFHTGRQQQADGVNRIPYLGAGGQLAVVPKSAAHSDAAFALLSELSGVDVSGQIIANPAWGSGPTRNEHLSKVEVWNSYGLSPEQLNRFVETLQRTLTYPGLKNPVIRLRTPDEHAHQQILLKAVRAAVLEGKDAHAALTEAAQDWEEIDRRTPIQERLTQYRRSLGLQ